MDVVRRCKADMKTFGDIEERAARKYTGVHEQVELL